MVAWCHKLITMCGRKTRDSSGVVLPFIVAALVTLVILYAAFAQTWALYVDREKNQRVATQATMDALVSYYRSAAPNFPVDSVAATVIAQTSVSRNYQVLELSSFRDSAPVVPVISLSWGVYVQSTDTFTVSADVSQVNAVKGTMPAVVGVGQIFGTFLPSVNKAIVFTAGFWFDDWGHLHEFETP